MGTNCRGVEYDDKDMTIAGLQAKISVFMQTMATLAKTSKDLHELAKATIKRADKAQMSVNPDDLYDSSKINLN